MASMKQQNSSLAKAIMIIPKSAVDSHTIGKYSIFRDLLLNNYSKSLSVLKALVNRLAATKAQNRGNEKTFTFVINVETFLCLMLRDAIQSPTVEQLLSKLSFEEKYIKNHDKIKKEDMVVKLKSSHLNGEENLEILLEFQKNPLKRLEAGATDKDADDCMEIIEEANTLPIIVDSNVAMSSTTNSQYIGGARKKIPRNITKNDFPNMDSFQKLRKRYKQNLDAFTGAEVPNCTYSCSEKPCHSKGKAPDCNVKDEESHGRSNEYSYYGYDLPESASLFVDHHYLRSNCFNHYRSETDKYNDALNEYRHSDVYKAYHGIENSSANNADVGHDYYFYDGDDQEGDDLSEKSRRWKNLLFKLKVEAIRERKMAERFSDFYDFID
ncbi:uncharacterized protein LOC119689271 [Teleopsis dalmanni]|uniref:uncharacterized protein LOC119689271 n=1 Tax=Teleopsis dalmanni TaxID=139649 RepID=UPI0018CF6C20|nr:uncharacterized protein LOC119689271 [Teleopsis dalmanni]